MYKPQLSENRILIIDEAHKLTPEAESSLLKILEEPSINSIIILVTPFPNQLMPTILSRLLPVRFAKEPDESLKNFLINIYQIPHKQLTLYLELGQNKIGEIFQLINNPEYLNTKISNIRIFIDLLNSNFVEATNIIQNITNKDEYNLAQLVNDWLGFLQQILVYKNIDF
jgi:DNA polymerase-3 subunit delta'